MRLALLCATHRGRVFLERVVALRPDLDLLVFSFPEQRSEPPFLEDIRATTQTAGGTFVESRRVGAEEHRAVWANNPPDLLVAVAWRYMVPAAIYRRPPRGSWVFHDSLLPANRGFSPTVWSMIRGETQTGVTLFRMSEEVDAGPIVCQRAVPIGSDDTIAEVRSAVTDAYLGVLDETLDGLLAGEVALREQDHSRATSNPRRTPDDNRIDWSLPARRIYDLVRATTRPYPGAFSSHRGLKLTVWSAAPCAGDGGGRPGEVTALLDGCAARVQTGDGALLLREVEFEANPDGKARVLECGHVLGS